MKAKFLIPLGLFVVLVGFLAVGWGWTRVRCRRRW